VKPKITDDFYITILGLHPFKEIVYLSNYYSTGHWPIILTVPRSSTWVYVPKALWCDRWAARRY
jgi:hypothetical protein